MIFFVVIITYSNSLSGDFIYDDEYFILKNINIRNLANVPSFFSNRSTVAFSGLSEEVYRPLTTLTLALNYFFGKVDVFGYHLVNMLLHAFNAILLFLFLYMLFDNLTLALFASLFFACHPVQTEAVTWISGRSSVLFTFFYLLAIICYIRFLKGSGKKYYLYSAMLAILAVFSKEMAFTLPLILLACDIHFFNKDGLRKKIYRSMPFFAIALFYIFSRSVILGRVSQCYWWGGSPYYTFLSMIRVFGDYIKLLVWPKDLCAFYPIDISWSIAETRVMIALGLLLIIAASIPFLFRRSRAASFAVIWFFVTMIPVSNIIPLKALMAERFLYLPSIGFCLLLALVIERMGAIKLKGVIKNGSAIACITATAIIIAYASRTIARNEDWSNTATITRSIIAVSPMNPWAYSAMATVYLASGKGEGAINPLKKSMALSKDYPTPRSSLGIVYTNLGRYDDAVKMFKEALTLRPDAIETINSLGVVYAKMRKFDDAVKEFELSIKLDPTYMNAYLNLGAVYERQSKFDKAIEQYNIIANRTNSIQDIIVSNIRIGDAYFHMGRKEQADGYYNKALDLCGRGLEELKKVIEERLKGHLPKAQDSALPLV